MTTLILSPRFNSEDMRAGAHKKGWEVHRALRMEPPDPECLVCVYGPIAFCDAMAERVDLGLLEPPNDWLSTLPYELVKRDLWFGTLADLGRVTGRAFIKPANDKLFEYGVYERGSDVPTKYLSADCPIIVSEVVAFDVEVRLHVLDGQVVTAGQYRLIKEGVDEVDAVRLATDFVAPHLESFRLPSSVVIDVGHIEGRGWAVIEANQSYASGMYYQEDPRRVLDTILRASGPRHFVRESDRPFLRNP